jgi:hypothetical protein
MYFGMMKSRLGVRELRQKLSNYEGVEWLEELPVPVIFARLKKEFPGIVKSASETDFFWCADLECQEEEIIEEYGSLPESPWPSNDGEGFELSFYRAMLSLVALEHLMRLLLSSMRYSKSLDVCILCSLLIRFVQNAQV